MFTLRSAGQINRTLVPGIVVDKVTIGIMKAVWCSWFLFACAAIIFACSSSRDVFRSKAFFMVSSPGINSNLSGIDVDADKSAVIQKPNAKFDTVYRIYIEIPSNQQIRIDSVQIADKTYLASLQKLLPEQEMIGSKKKRQDSVKLNNSPGKTWWQLHLNFAGSHPTKKSISGKAIIFGTYRGKVFKTVAELEELAPEFRM